MDAQQISRVPLSNLVEGFHGAATPINTNRSDSLLLGTIFAISMDNRTNIALGQAVQSRMTSPDELMIRQRGRRRNPVDWKPEQDTTSTMMRIPFQTTPTKMPLNTNMILRISPRKRLTIGSPLSDLCCENSNSPTKFNARQELWPETPVKKFHLCNDQKPIGQLNTELPLETVLQGFSQKQLIELIVGKLVAEDPTAEAELRKHLPLPDIECMQKELLHVKRMIFKSLPTSRLTQRTGSTGYTRASLHLNEFQRLLTQHTKQLQDSAHWDALLDYVHMAWPCVKSTPIWDNNIHNTIRRECFKLLTINCMVAVNRGGIQLGTTRLQGLEHSLKKWSQDYRDVLSCINTLSKVFSNSQGNV